MIRRVISGGQTGADQAGWRAAKKAGLETGGFMPMFFRTEDGEHPEFAEMYGAEESRSPYYTQRTRWNVKHADATIVFDEGLGTRKGMSGGTILAMQAADSYRKPIGLFNPNKVDASFVVDFLRKHNVETLNVAGNRESKSPGIGEHVEAFLDEVFRILLTEEQSA